MPNRAKQDLPFREPPSLSLATLLVAAPIFLLGAASLALQRYSEMWTLVWLPAGAAMGFAVLWGEKALLGIALGAFALALMDASTPLSAVSGAAASVAAVAAVVEATLGAALVQGLKAYPHGRVGPFAILEFFFLAAIVACVGGAVLDVGLLSLMGANAPSEVAGLFVVEALRHALGVAAGAPVIITLLNSPKGEIRRRLAPIAVVSAFALAVSLASYALESGAADRALQEKFAERAGDLARQIESTLQLGANAVGGMAGLFDTDDSRNLGDFQGVAKRVVEFDLGIQALEWIPRVRDEERALFESRMRAQWRRDYGITERDDGALVGATTRPEYDPVAYVYPLQGNEGALGFDLGSRPARKAALEAAISSGRAVATAGLELVQNGETGFLLFQPVFGARPGPAKGFAVGVFSAPRLLGIALRGQDMADLDYWALDVTDPTRVDVLAGNTGAPPPMKFAEGFGHRVDFAFGARKWAFEMAPTPAFLKRRVNLSRDLIRAAALLLTTLLCGAALVVTDRQRSLVDEREKALEDQKFALDQHAIVSITGPDGRITYANDKFCRISGYSQASLIGQRHNIVNSGLHAAEFYRELWNTITAGRVWSGEIGNRSASGELYWLQSTIVPLVGPDGVITQFIAICTDITQRKRLEQESRSQEQRLSIALSASSTGLWDYNPTTGKAFYSDTWYTMLGYRPGELEATGETFLGLMRPEDRRAYGDAFDSHASGGIGALEAEMRLRRKDGGWSWIKSVGKVIERGADGAPTRLIGVHIDITRERETQASLAAARDEAERANRAKTEFLATMSHEIRTPMNGVIGMISLLEDTALGDEQKRYVRTIRHSGEALVELINDILDFSKLEAGRLELERREFSPSAALENVLDIFEPAAVKKGLRIELRFEGDRIARGLGDPTRLRQILLNLCGNAVKFTQAGVVTLVMIGRIEANGKARLRYEVRDTGVGVAEEKRDRLFKPFSQGDASVTRKFGGTGLGLVISKRLAEAMDGEMSFDSAPGAGSVFWVEIPIAVTSMADLPAPRWRRRGVALKCAPERGRAAAQSLLSWCEFTVAESGSAELAFVDAAETLAPDGRFILFGEGGSPLRALAAGVIDGALAPGRITRVLAALEERPAEVERRSAPRAGAEKPLRVLIAEDHPTNQDVLSSLLRRQGHAVEIAENGREAIDLALSRDYDLVFMDVQMPEVDGLEATRRIRAAGGRRGAVRIVAMTASAMASDMEACRAAGMDEYLSKPIDRKKIGATLANAAAKLQ